MRVCVFEDAPVADLAPLTLTRPAFDLLCGSSSLLHKIKTCFAARDLHLWCRPELQEVAKLHHRDAAVNEAISLAGEPCFLVNARWLATPRPMTDVTTPHVACVDNEIAYVVPPKTSEPLRVEHLHSTLEKWRSTLPCFKMEGRMIQRPWDPIRHNPVQLQHDLAHLPEHRYRPANLAVSGPTDRLWVDPSAQIEPCVVADTSRGPVFIDQHAVVQSFARLEGPCYVGPHCWILGARIRNGTTLGTHCRVGGEIEASIIHGYSSKYHEGFLGHSYLGEWVNLAAGVQISDLRHDYGPIAMRVRGKSVDSEMTKLGSIIGDHTKIGLGVLLNTGTIIGAYCSILPGAGYAPREIPSFCTWVKGQLGEQHDPASLLKVAVEVMRRRGCELKSTHEELFHVVYDATTPHRQQSFRENDHRTYRRRSA